MLDLSLEILCISLILARIIKLPEKVAKILNFSMKLFKSERGSASCATGTIDAHMNIGSIVA